MIFGVLIVVIPVFAGAADCGSRPVLVAAPAAALRRGQLTDGLAGRADELLSRHLGGRGRATPPR